MKLYCQCGVLVADLKSGSQTRKGSVMLCKKCIDRLTIADNMAKMASKQSSDLFKGGGMPDFFKDIFPS